MLQSMKAVLDQSPFAQLKLSPEDEQKCRRIARHALRKALAEYDQFGPPQQRKFDKSRWKVIMTHETSTVYLDRETGFQKPKSSNATDDSQERKTNPRDPSSGSLPSWSLHSQSSHSEASQDDHDDDESEFQEGIGGSWKMPELVVSGTMPGTLDDVMYGMLTPDSAEFMLRTAYVDDHIQDGAVLYQIEMPTPDAPFQFLGVKWCIKDIPLQYKKLVWPRDFVFVEAMGILYRPDGSRLGYLIRHSVNLTGCGDLNHHGILRAVSTSASIYTPLPDNMVDIFVRGRANTHGKMKQGLSISLAAYAYLSSSKAVLAAKSKKLMGLVRRNDKNWTPAADLTSSRHACALCSKKFGTLTSVGTCRVCRQQMCSKCRLTRSLSFANEANDYDIEQMTAVFCINCVAQANQASAFDIARDEVLSGRYGYVPPPESQEPEPRESTANIERLLSFGLGPSVSSVSDCSFSSDDEEEYEVEYYNAAPAAATDAAAPSPMPSPNVLDHQNLQRQELWKKMSELRLQAESVYQLTKLTSDLHMNSSSASSASASNDSEAGD
ncbi:hypothetical protein FI667_g10719, partial [Globisporangium splendens]